MAFALTSATVLPDEIFTPSIKGSPSTRSSVKYFLPPSQTKRYPSLLPLIQTAPAPSMTL